MDVLSSSRLTGEYPKHISSARLSDPLEELKALPQWVAWRWHWNPKDRRWAKVPINPHTRRWAKPNDPSTWGSYQQALACKEEHEYDGVEFMFTEDDLYTGFDFDKCRNPETGVIHPAVVMILDRLNTYWEVSPSGTGIKAIIKGKKPGTRCVQKKTPWGGQLEIYDKKRFFTITEETIGERGSFVRDAQDVLDTLYRNLFPAPEKPVQPPVRTDTNHKRTLSERELLEKARNGKHGPKFIALYDHGDISGCGNNPSTADYHLCSQFAFWTGGDAVWMEALVSQSALGRREKWINRPHYRKTTIDRAIANTSGRYDPENEKYKPREGSTNTRDTVARLEQYAVIGYGWEEITGNSSSGASDYTVFVVMLQAAWKANSLEIDMNGRDLMVAGGFGKKATATDALARLVDKHRWCVKVADAKGEKAARYRITPHVDSKRDQALIREQFSSNYQPCEYQVLGPLLSQTVRIRNTSPTTDKEFDKNGRRIPQGKAAPVASVGMVAARVLDIIHYYSRVTGEPAPIGFLEERTNTRRNNLKSRPIRKLLEAGLILEVEGGYTTPDNVEEIADEELEISGSNAKTRMQKEKNAKEREISSIHLMRKDGADFDRIAAETGRSVAEIMDILKPPDEAPTYEDLDRQKEQREIRNADGYIGDLQKADGFGYFPNPKSREPRLISTAEVSKAEPLSEPSQEPRESRLSSSGEVSKGNVPEDKHPLGCDCLGCSITVPRYARPARTAPEAIREPLPERERELVPA